MIKGVQKGTTTMPVLRAFLLPTFRQSRTLFALCVKEAVRCVCVCVCVLLVSVKCQQLQLHTAPARSRFNGLFI